MNKSGKTKTIFIEFGWIFRGAVVSRTHIFVFLIKLYLGRSTSEWRRLDYVVYVDFVDRLLRTYQHSWLAHQLLFCAHTWNVPLKLARTQLLTAHKARMRALNEQIFFVWLRKCVSCRYRQHNNKCIFRVISLRMEMYFINSIDNNKGNFIYFTYVYKMSMTW